MSEWDPLDGYFLNACNLSCISTDRVVEISRRYLNDPYFLFQMLRQLHRKKVQYLPTTYLPTYLPACIHACIHTHTHIHGQIQWEFFLACQYMKIPPNPPPPPPLKNSCPEPTLEEFVDPPLHTCTYVYAHIKRPTLLHVFDYVLMVVINHGFRERTVVYPEKTVDARKQVLLPYSEYYGDHRLPQDDYSPAGSTSTLPLNKKQLTTYSTVP